MDHGESCGEECGHREGEDNRGGDKAGPSMRFFFDGGRGVQESIDAGGEIGGVAQE